MPDPSTTTTDPEAGTPLVELARALYSADIGGVDLDAVEAVAAVIHHDIVPVHANPRVYRTTLGRAAGQLLQREAPLSAAEVTDALRVLRVLRVELRPLGEPTPPVTVPSPSDPPPPDDSAPLADALAQARRRADAAARLNSDTAQRGHSWSLPHTPPALTWTSSRHWLGQVYDALSASPARKLLAERRLPLPTVFAVASACARLADSRTGRGITASCRTIGVVAGRILRRGRPLAADTVKRARRILAQLGLAVECARGRYLTRDERDAALAHHGGTQIRAASVWALVSPKDTVCSRLPSGSSTPRKGPTGSGSPNARATRTRKAPSGRPHMTPTRTRHAHRVTAQLLTHAPGLDTGRHLGSLVDVVAEHVDCTRWTGHDLAHLLFVDARTGHRHDWPTHIANPAAFLRFRLRRLAPTLAGPSPRDRHEQDRRALRALRQPPAGPPASAGTRRQALTHLRTILDARRRRSV